MPTLLRLSKVERENLREAFRKVAWLEPSASAPNDPEKSEWAAFEDDVLFAMVPVIEEMLEARANDETSTTSTGTTSTGRQKADTTGTAAGQSAGPAPGDEHVSSQKPGESFGDFLSDVAGPFVGDLAGIFVGGFGARPGARAPKPPTATDLLNGLIPTGLDLLNGLLDATQDKTGKPGQPWKDAGADTP